MPVIAGEKTAPLLSTIRDVSGPVGGGMLVESLAEAFMPGTTGLPAVPPGGAIAIWIAPSLMTVPSAKAFPLLPGLGGVMMAKGWEASCTKFPLAAPLTMLCRASPVPGVESM